MSEHLTPDPIVCLEWPLANEATEQVQGRTFSDIVTATGNQTIVFPHVDSCVAVAIVLQNGDVVAGHATMTPPQEKEGKLVRSDNFGYQVSLEDILERMARKCGGEDNIAQVVFAGGHEWMPQAREQISKLNHGRIPVKTMGTEKTRDVFIDLGTRTIKVQDWKADATRPAYQPPVLRDGHSEVRLWGRGS